MNNKKRILVADDEQVIVRVLETELLSENYQVVTAYDGEEAVRKIKEFQCDLAVLDVRMPKKDGLQILKEIKRISPDTIIIMMTAFGTIDNAVEAMKIGAYDYLTKPFENNDLLKTIRQALLKKAAASHTAPPSDNPQAIELVGQSGEMLRLKDKINKVKDLDTTVLLTGESGTGKGVVARTLHNLSCRRNFPFIHINCAVLPPTLIESELFGHEKGSFTGAVESKKGKIELAGKGTLFLDEISTLPPNLQAKLLTMLQEKSVERVGGMKTIPVRARIIAATNDNLEEAIRNREFREDLYYRLNIISIECPPLRFRKDDLDALVTYFLQKHNLKMNKSVTFLAPEVWSAFRRYDWPGNVRELENTIESAVAMSSGSTLQAEDLPLRIGRKTLSATGRSEGTLHMQELEAIKTALTKHNGHREKAAKELGISRRTLQYKLNKFGLRE